MGMIGVCHINSTLTRLRVSGVESYTRVMVRVVDWVTNTQPTSIPAPGVCSYDGRRMGRWRTNGIIAWVPTCCDPVADWTRAPHHEPTTMTHGPTSEMENMKPATSMMRPLRDSRVGDGEAGRWGIRNTYGAARVPNEKDVRYGPGCIGCG